MSYTTALDRLLEAEREASWLRHRMRTLADECEAVAGLIEAEAVSQVGDGLRSPAKVRAIAGALRREAESEG